MFAEHYTLLYLRMDEIQPEIRAQRGRANADLLQDVILKIVCFIKARRYAKYIRV